MDNDALNPVSRDVSTRQFWLKPWGNRRFAEHPTAQKGTQVFAAPQIQIRFAQSKSPPSVQIGDILFVYHIKLNHLKEPALVCVTEAVSSPFLATAEEVRKEAPAQTYPWTVRSRNLTLDYGSSWSNYLLNPFALAKEYIRQNPLESVTRQGKTIRALNHGMTVLWIQEGFAKFLISEVLRLH